MPESAILKEPLGERRHLVRFFELSAVTLGAERKRGDAELLFPACVRIRRHPYPANPHQLLSSIPMPSSPFRILRIAPEMSDSSSVLSLARKVIE